MALALTSLRVQPLMCSVRASRLGLFRSKEHDRNTESAEVAWRLMKSGADLTYLSGVTEDQTIEIGVVAKRIEVMIVLSAHTKIWLQVKRSLQRFQGEINRTQASTGGSQSVVNMCRFRLAFEGSFKHLLGGYILAPIQFDDPSIVKGVSVAGEHAFGSQTRFRNREVGAGARRHLGNLRVLVNQETKLIAGFSEAASRKLFVGSFEG